MGSWEEGMEHIYESRLHEIASMGKEMEKLRGTVGTLMTEQAMYADAITDLNRAHEQKEDALNIKVASLEKEIADLKQDRTSLLKENRRCWDNLTDHERRHADRDASMALLIQHVSDMRDKYELEKNLSLENCKETLEREFNEKHDKLRQQLRSAWSDLDYTKFLHAKTCGEKSARERKLKITISSLLQKLWPMIDKVEQNAREIENSMKEKMEKEQEEVMDFLWQSIESKIKEDLPEIMEIMMMKMKEQEEFKTSVWQRIASDLKEAFQKTKEMMIVKNGSKQETFENLQETELSDRKLNLHTIKEIQKKFECALTDNEISVLSLGNI